MSDLFNQLVKAYLAELQVEDFKSAPRYSANAFRWYCYEYLGMPSTLQAKLLGEVPRRFNIRFTEMREASENKGIRVVDMPGYRPYVELADDLARDLGFKPKSFTRMSHFDNEYRQWEVCQACGYPNVYVDADESTPFVAAEILDKIEGLDRKEAIRLISHNYGVYKL